MSYSCSVLKQLLKVVDFRTRHSTLSVLQSASVPLVVILPLYSCLKFPVSYSQVLQSPVHSITVSRYQFIQLLSSLPPSLIGWVFFFPVSSSEERKPLPISRSSKLCSQMYVGSIFSPWNTYYLHFQSSSCCSVPDLSSSFLFCSPKNMPQLQNPSVTFF